jgi:hypothetical protein
MQETSTLDPGDFSHICIAHIYYAFDHCKVANIESVEVAKVESVGVAKIESVEVAQNIKPKSATCQNAQDVGKKTKNENRVRFRFRFLHARA